MFRKEIFMKRNIIEIDENKCNGCGLCVNACHEGALQLVNGKARLISESYCDGLGACLPECPTGAINITEKEAAAFDEEAVAQNMSTKHEAEPLPCGCPGSLSRTIEKSSPSQAGSSCQTEPAACVKPESQLRQWPCQIKLAPVNAPYFNNAHLLVAADCTAYAYANFHNDFMKKKITLIGCPKLDSTEYSEKLGEILRRNDIKSVTVLRMEVPCCGGMENAVKSALISSGKMIPWSVVTISTEGEILDS